VRGLVFPLIFATLATRVPGGGFHVCTVAGQNGGHCEEQQSQSAAGVMHGDMPLHRAGRHGEYHLLADDPGRCEGLVRLYPAGRRQELWRARRR
jgi:hypothetical protein